MLPKRFNFSKNSNQSEPSGRVPSSRSRYRWLRFVLMLLIIFLWSPGTQSFKLSKFLHSRVTTTTTVKPLLQDNNKVPILHLDNDQVVDGDHNDISATINRSKHNSSIRESSSLSSVPESTSSRQTYLEPWPNESNFVPKRKPLKKFSKIKYSSKQRKTLQESSKLHQNQNIRRQFEFGPPHPMMMYGGHRPVPPMFHQHPHHSFPGGGMMRYPMRLHSAPPQSHSPYHPGYHHRFYHQHPSSSFIPSGPISAPSGVGMLSTSASGLSEVMIGKPMMIGTSTHLSNSEHDYHHQPPPPSLSGEGGYGLGLAGAKVIRVIDEATPFANFVRRQMQLANVQHIEPLIQEYVHHQAYHSPHHSVNRYPQTLQVHHYPATSSATPSAQPTLILSASGEPDSSPQSPRQQYLLPVPLLSTTTAPPIPSTTTRPRLMKDDFANEYLFYTGSKMKRPRPFSRKKQNHRHRNKSSSKQKKHRPPSSIQTGSQEKNVEFDDDFEIVTLIDDNSKVSTSNNDNNNRNRNRKIQENLINNKNEDYDNGDESYDYDDENEEEESGGGDEELDNQDGGDYRNVPSAIQLDQTDVDASKVQRNHRKQYSTDTSLSSKKSTGSYYVIRQPQRPNNNNRNPNRPSLKPSSSSSVIPNKISQRQKFVIRKNRKNKNNNNRQIDNSNEIILEQSSGPDWSDTIQKVTVAHPPPLWSIDKSGAVTRSEYPWKLSSFGTNGSNNNNDRNWNHRRFQITTRAPISRYTSLKPNFPSMKLGHLVGPFGNARIVQKIDRSRSNTGQIPFEDPKPMVSTRVPIVPTNVPMVSANVPMVSSLVPTTVPMVIQPHQQSSNFTTLVQVSSRVNVQNLSKQLDWKPITVPVPRTVVSNRIRVIQEPRRTVTNQYPVLSVPSQKLATWNRTKILDTNKSKKEDLPVVHFRVGLGKLSTFTKIGTNETRLIGAGGVKVGSTIPGTLDIGHSNNNDNRRLNPGPSWSTNQRAQVSNKSDDMDLCKQNGNQGRYFADKHNKCKTYLHCGASSGGGGSIVTRFSCPIGTKFSEERLICDWPNKIANC